MKLSVDSLAALLYLNLRADDVTSFAAFADLDGKVQDKYRRCVQMVLDHGAHVAKAEELRLQAEVFAARAELASTATNSSSMSARGAEAGEAAARLRDRAALLDGGAS